MTYGNTVSESTSYNARMQPTSYTLNNVNYTNTIVYPNQSFSSMSWSYDYYADGRVNHAYDSTWNFWDRSFSYDHVGRLQEADSNRVARGQSWDYWHPDPYQQTSNYDVWNNLKLTGYQYNFPQNDSATYSNNRRSDSSYDANGNVTSNLGYNNSIDVASQNTHAISHQMVGDGSAQWPERPELEITQSYDGNGQPLKRNQITRMNEYDLETGEFAGVDEVNQTTYYLRSSVLGGAIIDELGRDWQNNVFKSEGYVYAGGQRIAKQTAGQYEQHNPVTGSWVSTNASNRYMARQERDPVGGTIPLDAPPSNSTYASQNFGAPLFVEGGDPSDFSGGCQLDGMATACSNVAHQLDTGSAVGSAYVDGKKVVWDFTGHGALGLDLLSHGPIWLTMSSSSTAREWTGDPDNPGDIPPGGETSTATWTTTWTYISAGLGFRGRLLFGQGRPQRPAPTPTPTPCDVQIPTDANDQAVLATILGEAAYPGTATYYNAMNDGRGNSSHEAVNHPDGVASDSEIYIEMELMVSVFVNRHRDDAGNPSWYDIANSLQENGVDYQMEGYPHGKEQLKNLGPIDGGVCEQAHRAVKAIDWVKNNGPLFTNIHNWRSVVQRDLKPPYRPFVRVKNGAIRRGGTDFF